MLHRPGLSPFIRLAIQIQTMKKATGKEIPAICIIISAIESCMDMSDCMRAEEPRTAAIDDDHLGTLSELVLCS